MYGAVGYAAFLNDLLGFGAEHFTVSGLQRDRESNDVAGKTPVGGVLPVKMENILCV